MQQNPIWIEPTRWAMHTKVLACRPLRQPCTSTKEVDTNTYCSLSFHFVPQAAVSPGGYICTPQRQASHLTSNIPLDIR